MIAVLLLFASVAFDDISGVVRDPTGAVVQGASVIVRTPEGAERRAVTGPDGRFTVEAPETPSGGNVTLIARADGFAESEQRTQVGARELEIVLRPGSVLESVTVTATRAERRAGDVPASVSVIAAEEIKESPAVVADDILRQTPTFSLFRRTSSLSSHPTSQGVSLRGIGPSGVSRTLVLLDGVPFNDPFGGWVYWSRVPLGGTDHIEVVDSSSSNLYGNYAMGGVINVVASRPARRTIEIKPQYGNLKSPKLDVFASDIWGKVSASFDSSLFTTDGYPIVVPAERGPVDNKATDEFKTFNLKLNYSPNDRVSTFLRTGYFRENRDNGKASTIDGTEEANDTRWTTINGGIRVALPDQSDLQALVFSDFETFHSNFLAVPAANPPRSIGRMTLNQTVPTTGVGGMVQWSKAILGHQSITAGTDWHWVRGDSDEDGLDAVTGTRVTLHRVSGGKQQLAGAFVQDLITPITKLEVTVSARVDHWRNFDAHNLETSVPSGLPTANNRLLPDRDDTVVSPHVGGLYHVTDRVGVWGGVGSGFRAPTLNELYRQFRVGNVLTLPNAQLGPERLVGGEAGLTVAPSKDVTWRITWFDNRVGDPVSNITQSVAGTQITRVRGNLGSTHVWGVQSDVTVRLGQFVKLAGGYVYDQAKVAEFAADPALVGLFIPQVPQHRGTAQATYVNPKYVTASVQAQFVARQFDDDQNQFPLPGYMLTDLHVTRRIAGELEAFFGVQNVFNRQVIVATNPTLNGAPRLFNGGVRVRFAPRSP
jgi:outer membrane receptor protein involved in Fe transport